MTTSTISAPETAPETLPAPPVSNPFRASLPGWGARRPALPGPGNPDPNPAPATDSDTRPADGAAPSPSPAQDPASIRAFFKQRASSYARIAKTLLEAAGGMLNGSAAKAAGADTDAWLPDDDDLETITPPLGRIAARRIKVGANPDQLSDVEDIGIAAVGLIMWAAKGLVAVAEARRYKRRLEADKTVHADAGDGR